MNYYRFYPGDYAGDTQHLSMLQHGAYCMLLNHCYSREVPQLPESMLDIYRICRAVTEEEQAAAKFIVQEFFPCRINGRVAKQLPEEQARVEAGRERGRKGSEARWGKKSSEQCLKHSLEHSLEVCQESCPPTPTPTPSPTPEKHVKAHRANGARRADAHDPVFEEEWGRRPRRSGTDSKQAAYRAWRARLKDGVDREAMASGLQRYLAWCEAVGKIGTEYVMQTATFLGPDRHFDQPWDVAEKGKDNGKKKQPWKVGVYE